MLVDYEFYKTHCDEYGKEQALEASSFSQFSYKAQMYLNMRTFGRINRKFDKFSSELQKTVKDCICSLAEIIYEEKSTHTPTHIHSEKVADYSVTFSSPEEIKKEYNERKNETVIEYLYDTNLLYAGVLSDVYE